MVISRLLAAAVVLVCMQLAGMAVFVVATAGRDGVLTAVVLAAVGLVIGVPAMGLALRSTTGGTRRAQVALLSRRTRRE